jgi:hypothetical protein
MLTLACPRTRNLRKPMASLMIPNTGSMVCCLAHSLGDNHAAFNLNSRLRIVCLLEMTLPCAGHDAAFRIGKVDLIFGSRAGIGLLGFPAARLLARLPDALSGCHIPRYLLHGTFSSHRS